MHLLFVVSDTLTGCNLCWTVSCPTWWYAELSEHRSNIQSTSACSCFYITDMNLLKFTHIIIHHTDPHTLNRNHVLSSDCDRWSGFPAPTRVYFKDLKHLLYFRVSLSYLTEGSADCEGSESAVTLYLFVKYVNSQLIGGGMWLLRWRCGRWCHRSEVCLYKNSWQGNTAQFVLWMFSTEVHLFLFYFIVLFLFALYIF